MYSLVASRSAIRYGARAAATATSSAKYSSTSTMHENDADVLEKEKRRNLSKTQHKTSTPHEHAPGWNETLASASEAAVKADKSTTSKESMQSETVKYMKARHSEDADSGSESTTAYYQRDEVSGPLSGAKGKEEVSVHKGHAVEDKAVNDPVTEELGYSMKPTTSEEDVKADRGEV